MNYLNRLICRPHQLAANNQSSNLKQDKTVASFYLKSPNYNGLKYLRDYHTFGRRKDSVDTYIDHSYVSKFHAVIEWRQPNWLLKDVSKNGLKLNNKIIPAQSQVTLTVGDTIDFAGAGEATLTINNIDAPVPMLINTASPTETYEIAESSLLPNECSPELALYLCPDRQQWFAESVEDGIEAGPFEHGDAIEFGNTQWNFLLIAEDDATKEFNPKQTSLDDVAFRFDLSQDEESTSLTLIKDGLEIELGERSHHYLLVHLLRHREAQSNGSGWLDGHLLFKELGLEEAHVNIQIFRARKQVAAAMPSAVGHSKLIERRRGALRVNISNFEIYKEGVKEV